MKQYLTDMNRERKRFFTKWSLTGGGRLREVVAMRELTVVPCLYLRYILGKFSVPRLIVVQLIQAIYLLNKNTAQKNFVTKKSILGTLPV